MEQCEVWRPIKGYEGLYEVSSLGRVKSLERILPHKVHGTWHIKERILRPGLTGRYPSQYLGVVLHSGGGKQSMMRVHRLVAEAFLPRMPGKNFVNHIDCNRMNNAASNLEWTTPLENTRHAKANGRMIESAAKRMKAVICNETGQWFESVEAAGRWRGIGGENITRNISGWYHTAGGYTWRWADEQQ